MRAKKVDTTHGAIRDHLRAIGWRVYDTASVGSGFPDLVVSRLGFTALVECKSGSEAGAESELNEAQRRFRDGWQGSYVVAATPEQAERELSARLLGFRLEAYAASEVEP